jgi:superkiller protein 3
VVAAESAKDAGDYDTALGLFRDILAENPTIATAYVGIGDIHLIREDFDEAEPAFRRAAQLEPRNFDAQLGHGLALHMLSRFAEAVLAFHRALTIEPDSVEANLAIATTYLQTEKPQSALAFAERAVQADPNNGAARANLGAIYEMLGRNGEAVDQYLAALEILPPSPPLILNLINVLAKERRYDEVINTAENLLKIEPNADAWERMGYAYFRLSRYEDSLEAYRSAVELDPGHWQALNGIGVNSLNAWLLSKKRDPQPATAAGNAFRRSLQINPDQEKVIFLLSNYRL